MNILITGVNGQLANEFIRQLSSTGHSLILPAESELDITNSENVHSVFAQNRPDVVLNCAAYNLVDAAEKDPATAMRVNADGVKFLASAAREQKALLVHYSTDYVFDGAKENFYDEDDQTNPINVYGRSKLAGENIVRSESDRFLLFRLSWVFGPGTQNFLFKLSEWAKKNDVLKVVYDQISVPCYTEDIARITLKALEANLEGLYHLTNSGYASRYELAKYFLERLSRTNLVLPVDSTHFPTAAKRPFFTAMSNAKISRALDIKIPPWTDAIDRYVATIR